jgi:Ni,Fe-hydrogenase III small subunit/NAD-dependent dihydropyrimidine dehydrogenase PreA subunit
VKPDTRRYSRITPLVELARARLRQGFRTHPFPAGTVSLPERFRGRPALEPERCEDGCRACVDACPVAAVSLAPLRMDLGACVFCPGCAEACPSGAITFTRDHRLAASTREELVVGRDEVHLARALRAETMRVFGRSLRLRQVSAAGCNACEADLNVAANVVTFDMSRFGVQFVASPRHADGIVLTGCVSANMRQAVLDTWAAVPSPRIVVALGACAISGGPFRGSDAQGDGAPAELPIDLYVPGCPPHPFTILDGFVRLLGRMP